MSAFPLCLGQKCLMRRVAFASGAAKTLSLSLSLAVERGHVRHKPSAVLCYFPAVLTLVFCLSAIPMSLVLLGASRIQPFSSPFLSLLDFCGSFYHLRCPPSPSLTSFPLHGLLPSAFGSDFPLSLFCSIFL